MFAVPNKRPAAVNVHSASQQESELKATLAPTLNYGMPSRGGGLRSGGLLGPRRGDASASRGALNPGPLHSPTRPGSTARSQVSGVSGATGRSRASAASAVSTGALLAKDKLAHALGLLPPERRLEVEAERLRLIQMLLLATPAVDSEMEAAGGVDSDVCNPAAARGSGACTSLSGTAPASLSSSPAVLAAAQSAASSTDSVPTAQQVAPAGAAAASPQRRLPPQPQLPALISGHYLLDFGPVVKGLSKSRKVRLSNLGSQAVALVIDKACLEAHGFAMLPEAAVKLGGAPECQSTEVTFTVAASKQHVQPGQLELTLPLAIKGGPAVLLTLRALIVVPDILPSDTSIDFGAVGVGHCRVRTLLYVAL